MKILEEGIVPLYKSRCSECHTLFEYERADIKHKFLGSCYGVPFHSSVVQCPKCKMNVGLSEPDDD